MSGHKYVTNPNNLFEDDDNDVDDETFLRNSRVNNSSSSGVSTNPFEEQKQAFEEKRKQIESRTLESSKRSLGLLHETEEVGRATATELTKQREQLERTSHQLDEISATLRFSQKHLNGLKSVFGGLKNYLAGNRGSMPPSSSQPTSAVSTSSSSNSKLTSATNTNGNCNNVDNECNDNHQMMSPDEQYNSHPISRLRDDEIQNGIQQQQQQRGTFDQLERNLDDMCGSLSRLKGLATDLQQEIESQNEILDNMNYKMEDVDLKVNKQNKEMNKLLGKK